MDPIGQMTFSICVVFVKRPFLGVKIGLLVLFFGDEISVVQSVIPMENDFSQTTPTNPIFLITLALLHQSDID